MTTPHQPPLRPGDHADDPISWESSPAFYDQLSDLPNRTLLLDRLKQTLTASARDASHGALLFIDLGYLFGRPLPLAQYEELARLRLKPIPVPTAP